MSDGQWTVRIEGPDDDVNVEVTGPSVHQAVRSAMALYGKSFPGDAEPLPFRATEDDSARPRAAKEASEGGSE